jgi:hypothetical protein|tara:strand:+ start:16 stop:129 length:114 start_codon:yes stop_codon:yes gene_type:complete
MIKDEDRPVHPLILLIALPIALFCTLLNWMLPKKKKE